MRSKTPRMWGWTDFFCHCVVDFCENPTYVGMDRSKITEMKSSLSKTPRMWGWTVM